MEASIPSPPVEGFPFVHREAVRFSVLDGDEAREEGVTVPERRRRLGP